MEVQCAVHYLTPEESTICAQEPGLDGATQCVQHKHLRHTPGAFQSHSHLQDEDSHRPTPVGTYKLHTFGQHPVYASEGLFDEEQEGHC
jgi:hypothetical protein